ncbi:hypothetical protein BJY21_002134 [Kineosphaera limosa]|uniref:Virulence factor domain-containing protein n=1 Tax=Kineosphaera limosa NBRC 100340 TaxID=1184609 RepID=K6X7U1_9MICO|nr:virulence factor [Kineosphaera limosa]NYE00950.1 hypothetical protein [Kineosphaera limosa]GAB94854.1 hypothetical protein KILIM_013_00090 [Kineosphaera limosa NBRC 100340]
MAQYQIMAWRDLPSMVTVRDDEAADAVVKVSLPARFQEAIDEAAMRLGASGSDDYLMGWDRGPWTPAEGEAQQVADAVAADLESRWDDEALAAYLDAIGPPSA